MDDEYHARISNLYDVINRLSGVLVISQFDAFTYIKLNNYHMNPRVMIYCDPPYLKQEYSKEEILDGISLEILKRESNPGKIYKDGWTLSNHVYFLEFIKDAKCRVVVSNYDDDLHLYDSYLRSPKWKKIEYDTTTSVSRKNTKRKECLWYNY